VVNMWIEDDRGSEWIKKAVTWVGEQAALRNKIIV
jgi:hypothetical protein